MLINVFVAVGHRTRPASRNKQEVSSPAASPLLNDDKAPCNPESPIPGPSGKGNPSCAFADVLSRNSFSLLPKRSRTLLFNDCLHRVSYSDQASTNDS